MGAIAPIAPTESVPMYYAIITAPQSLVAGIRRQRRRRRTQSIVSRTDPRSNNYHVVLPLMWRRPPAATARLQQQNDVTMTSRQQQGARACACATAWATGVMWAHTAHVRSLPAKPTDVSADYRCTLASPAMGHRGTCPLDFQLVFFVIGVGAQSTLGARQFCLKIYA